MEKKRPGKKLIIIIAAAALVVVAAVCVLLWWFMRPSSYIILDLNPSVQLSVNGQGKVSKLEGLNEDGKSLLANYEMADKELDFVLGEVLDLYLMNWPADGEDVADVLVTMGANIPEARVTELNTLIMDYFDYHESDANVWQQSVELTGTLRDDAESFGISPGRMALADRLAGAGSTAREELAPMTVTELLEYADENELDTGLADLYQWYWESVLGGDADEDDDDDDSLAEQDPEDSSDISDEDASDEDTSSSGTGSSAPEDDDDEDGTDDDEDWTDDEDDDTGDEDDDTGDDDGWWEDDGGDWADAEYYDDEDWVEGDWEDGDLADTYGDDSEA